MMDGYDMNAWGWFGMLLLVILTAAIIGLVAWTIVARSTGGLSQRELSAREQLDARLAQGESTRRNTTNDSTPSARTAQAPDVCTRLRILIPRRGIVGCVP